MNHVLSFLILSMSACWQGLPAPETFFPKKYIPPKGYVCCRAKPPLKIDGKIDDKAWQPAPWTDAFVDIEGDEKPEPRFRTRVKMLWDDDYFYIVAKLEEPHVWGTLTSHDSVIYHDNDFEVFIDPDGDNHNYMEYEINALGTDWDLFLPKPYKDKGKADDSWEIKGLKKAVHVIGTVNNPSDLDKGWTVEIAFPWKALGKRGGVRVPPKDGEQWRVNFSRVQWKHIVVKGKYQKLKGFPEDNWVWSPQWTVNMHRPETWGYVQFSTAPPGKAKFVPDETGPARHLLHRVYYAQRRFRHENNRWAKSLKELQLENLNHPSLAGPISLKVSGKACVVSAKVKLKNGEIQVIRLHQNAHIETSAESAKF